MNLFGVSFNLSKNNGKYIKQKECYETRDGIKKEVRAENEKTREAIGGVHNRIDKLYQILLKK